MSKVIAWKSDADGKLFEDKKEYISHLRKLASDRALTRKMEDAKNKRKEFVDRMTQVSTISELETFIKENWEWFYFNGLEDNIWKFQSKSQRAIVKVPHKLHSLNFSLTRKEDISNSHACPAGGVTNWRRDEKFEDGTLKPTFYPGWHGRLEFNVLPGIIPHRKRVTERSGFGSDYFYNTPVKTGSGGSRYNAIVGTSEKVDSYSYDVILFDDDWPNLIKKHKNFLLMSSLGNDERMNPLSVLKIADRR